MTRIDKHEPGTVTWVDLMSSDPEKARAFYGALFGWTFDVGPAETGFYAMAKLDGANACGIGGQPPGSQFPPAWSVYFGTADADATIAKVKELGGSVVMGPMDVMEEGRLAFLADPTGAHFGVWQPRRHQGAQVIDEPGAMTWREVNTPDAAKARDFYGKVFGLESRKLDGPMEYWTLHKGDTTVGGVLQMTKEWAGVPPHWMTYFAVPDADAAAKRVAELGGKVSVPPFDTPYGRMSVVNDPTGAVFSIIRLAEPK
jgi:predicted enzyme related to lactoylglutathione lyase